MCAGWKIPQAELPKIIKECKPISGVEMDAQFDVLLCIISGQLTQEGQTYNFEINGGSWMRIYCPDTALFFGDFNKRSKKYFLSDIWRDK